MSDQIVTLTPANIAHGIWNVCAEESSFGEFVFPPEVKQCWKLPMAVSAERPDCSGGTCFTVTVRRTEKVEGTDEFPFPHDEEKEVLQIFHVTVSEMTPPRRLSR